MKIFRILSIKVLLIGVILLGGYGMAFGGAWSPSKSSPGMKVSFVVVNRGGQQNVSIHFVDQDGNSADIGGCGQSFVQFDIADPAANFLMSLGLTARAASEDVWVFVTSCTPELIFSDIQIGKNPI